jgi:hypothetical protein
MAWTFYLCRQLQVPPKYAARVRETKLVVSTIGSMYLPSEGSPLEIGAGRYYETMVFHAAPAGPYWDADVRRQISSFEPKWAIGTLHESADNEANDMHEAVVAWFQEQLAAGRTFTEAATEEEGNADGGV